MWLSVSELSRLIQMSPRTVQSAIKDRRVDARKKDGKSYEVDLSTLPPDLMSKLPEEWRQQAGALTLVEGRSSLVMSTASQTALGRRLTGRERQKAEIAAFYSRLDPTMLEGQKAAAVCADLERQFFCGCRIYF